MPDYRKMYYILFNKITDIVKELNDVQQKTEQIFLEQEELIVLLSTESNQPIDNQTNK